MKRPLNILPGVLLLSAAASAAPPPVEMEGTAIIGEQEQPRVRFTIPWREVPPAPDHPRPWTSRQEEAAIPLDPVYFRQLLRFQSLAASPRGADAPPVAAEDKNTRR